MPFLGLESRAIILRSFSNRSQRWTDTLGLVCGLVTVQSILVKSGPEGVETMAALKLDTKYLQLSRITDAETHRNEPNGAQCANVCLASSVI